MKKTLAMIMALCMMLTALCSVAFADGGYQIQVVDPDGYPVKGVAVQFCSDTECRMAKTDEDGIASFDVPAGSYTIHLLKVPAGYEKDPREYIAPETPDLVTLTINQEGRPEQSVAAAGSHAKGADESEFVIDEPVLGLHFVMPEELRNLKGSLNWNADFVDSGLLNLSVEYYAVEKENMKAYAEFYQEYVQAYLNDEELPEPPDPSWMSGCESAYVYDLYTINEDRGEKELREILSDAYGLEDDQIASITEIGSDGDCHFFSVQYTAAEEQMKQFHAVMGDEFFSELEALRNDQGSFLSGLTLSAPEWPEELSAGDSVSFETVDFAGNPVNSADLFAQSKVTMINLWATWCGPCKGELPELGKMAKDFEAQGCQLVGLCIDATDDDVVATAEALLADAGAEYLNLRAMEGVDEIFPVQGYPTSFFVDSEGKLLVDPVVGAYPDAYTESMAEALALVG